MKKNIDQENEKQLRLIGSLATRLPWIVVIVTVLTALVTLVELYFFH